MEADSHTSPNTRHVAFHDSQTHVKDGDAQISIGHVENIIVGHNSKMVISSKSKSRSRTKGKSSHDKKDIPCQYPLTKSLHNLTIDQKLDIKDRVGGHWKDLGRRLGLSDSELEQLEMENSSNCPEVIYQILTRWEQRVTEGATCGALAIVFQKLGRGDLADLLSESALS